MWWIRYKETKERIVLNSRVGFWPAERRYERTATPCLFNKVPGCQETVVSRHWQGGKPMQVTSGKCHQCGKCGRCRVCTACGKCGRYPLPYSDLNQVVKAVANRGILLQDLELYNINGYTMQDMVTWPVQVGFALRHRAEQWYWSYPNNGRVWYQAADRAETAWRKTEAVYSVAEDRDERRSPGQQRLEMVRGYEDKHVEVLKLWF